MPVSPKKNPLTTSEVYCINDSSSSAKNTNANIIKTSGTTRLKLIVLGGMNAGKTCLLRRYCFNTFESERKATIGADFFTKMITNPLCSIDDDDDDDNNNIIDPMVHVQLWDTAGLERCSSNSSCDTLGTAFFRNIHGALLVYDATSHSSYTSLIQWHKALLENTCNKVPIVVVANKTDKLKHELEKPFLKMVPQRNVLGIVLSSLSDNNNNNIVKFHGPGLKQMTLQDVTRKTGKHYGNSVVPLTPTNSNKNINTILNNNSSIMMQGDTTTASPENLQDQVIGDDSIGKVESYSYNKPCGAIMLPEEKAYSLSPNADFYGSYYRDLLMNNANEGKDSRKGSTNANTQLTVSYKSIWKESFTIDDTLPDRDMVLKWGKSNNVTFSGASALDGTGVNEAMESLIKLSLTKLYKQEQQQQTTLAGNSNAEITTAYYCNNNRIGTSSSSSRAAVASGGKFISSGTIENNYSSSNNNNNNKIVDLQARYKPTTKCRHSMCCGRDISLCSQCWPLFDDD